MAHLLILAPFFVQIFFTVVSLLHERHDNKKSAGGARAIGILAGCIQFWVLGKAMGFQLPIFTTEIFNWWNWDNGFIWSAISLFFVITMISKSAGLKQISILAWAALTGFVSIGIINVIVATLVKQGNEIRFGIGIGLAIMTAVGYLAITFIPTRKLSQQQ